MLSYLRVKAVEQLRIEGLTTRGQHHRKERFRSRYLQMGTKGSGSIVNSSKLMCFRSVTAPEEE